MKKHPYHILFTIFFLTTGLYSWGSVKLPQLKYNYFIVPDTIPAAPGTERDNKNNNGLPAEEPNQPIIKKVPKSKKKLKPAAIDPKVAVPVRIIKPKVVIKKINVNIP